MQFLQGYLEKKAKFFCRNNALNPVSVNFPPSEFNGKIVHGK